MKEKSKDHQLVIGLISQREMTKNPGNSVHANSSIQEKIELLNENPLKNVAISSLADGYMKKWGC